MHKTARRLLLPLLLANVTISANNWSIWGLGIGQIVYWVIIVIAWFLALGTPYRLIANALLVAGFLLRISEASIGGTLVAVLRSVSLGGLFVIAGAAAWGRQPRLLYRQLVLFVALCIPLMVLQMAGTSPLFMTWNTEYADLPSVLTVDEVGTFKQVPVSPTLFVPLEDLVYWQGQGRPVGLSYSNNVLSVFVAIALGLSVGMSRASRVRWAEIVVCTAVVLTMSMTAYLSTILIFVGVLACGEPWRKRLVVKMVAVVVFVGSLYYWAFPGLFAANLSNAKILQSTYTRAVELFDLLGIGSVRAAYEQATYNLGDFVRDDVTYSGVAKLLKSPIGAFLLLGAPVFAFFYYSRLRRLYSTLSASCCSAYVLTGLACLLSQFGVPYYSAPSFQFIMGFALYPMFRRLWPRLGHHPGSSPSTSVIVGGS